MRQVIYIIQRFRRLELLHQRRQRTMFEMAGIDSHGHVRRATNIHRMGLPIELYGETFYYFAFRLRQVLRGIEGWDTFEAEGVRNVRNQLIEHADKDRGVMHRTFAFDIPQGFISKPFGGSPGRIIDKGLYPNAKELVQSLLRRLEQMQQLKS
jgi:hypothetical protein